MLCTVLVLCRYWYKKEAKNFIVGEKSPSEDGLKVSTATKNDSLINQTL
jgi:hypothetical protein